MVVALRPDLTRIDLGVLDLREHSGLLVDKEHVQQFRGLVVRSCLDRWISDVLDAEGEVANGFTHELELELALGKV